VGFSGKRLIGLDRSDSDSEAGAIGGFAVGKRPVAGAADFENRGGLLLFDLAKNFACDEQSRQQDSLRSFHTDFSLTHCYRVVCWRPLLHAEGLIPGGGLWGAGISAL
jgi:hypothetical protein